MEGGRKDGWEELRMAVHAQVTGFALAASLQHQVERVNRVMQEEREGKSGQRPGGTDRNED